MSEQEVSMEEIERAALADLERMAPLVPPAYVEAMKALYRVTGDLFDYIKAEENRPGSDPVDVAVCAALAGILNCVQAAAMPFKPEPDSEDQMAAVVATIPTYYRSLLAVRPALWNRSAARERVAAEATQPGAEKGGPSGE